MYNQYIVRLHKYDYCRQGKEYYKNYEENDFDFLVCETGNKKHNFYVIPMKKLIKKGYIKTKNQSGKFDLKIPIEFDENHWTSKYYNKFSILK